MKYYLIKQPLLLYFSYDGQSWKATNAPQYVYDFNPPSMALYNEKPVMIGAKSEDLRYFDNPSDWRSNTSYPETFDPVTEEWSDLKRNPFFDQWAYRYQYGTSVVKEDSFLIFGGRLGIYKDKSFEKLSLSALQISFLIRSRFSISKTLVRTLIVLLNIVILSMTELIYFLFMNIEIIDGKI